MSCVPCTRRMCTMYMVRVHHAQGAHAPCALCTCIVCLVHMHSMHGAQGPQGIPNYVCFSQGFGRGPKRNIQVGENRKYWTLISPTALDNIYVHFLQLPREQIAWRSKTYFLDVHFQVVFHLPSPISSLCRQDRLGVQFLVTSLTPFSPGPLQSQPPLIPLFLNYGAPTHTRMPVAKH